MIVVPETMKGCQAIYFYNPSLPDGQEYAPVVRLCGGYKYPVYYYDSEDSLEEAKAKEEAFIQYLTRYCDEVNNDMIRAAAGEGEPNICEYVSDKVQISVTAKGALNSVDSEFTWNKGKYREWAEENEPKHAVIQRDENNQVTGIYYNGPAAVMEAYEMMYTDMQLYCGFNLTDPAHEDYRNYGRFVLRAYTDGWGSGWGLYMRGRCKMKDKRKKWLGIIIAISVLFGLSDISVLANEISVENQQFHKQETVMENIQPEQYVDNQITQSDEAKEVVTIITENEDSTKDAVATILEEVSVDEEYNEENVMEIVPQLQDFRVEEVGGVESGQEDEIMETASETSNDLKNAVVLFLDKTIVYTGEEVTPALAVLLERKVLVRDVDFECSYSNNINASNTASVTITGKGIYCGSVTKYFTIQPKNLSDEDINVSGISEETYTGNPIKKNITITYKDKQLQEGSDYKVLEYYNHVCVGTAKVKIIGIGNYRGIRKEGYKILARNPSIPSQSLRVDSAQQGNYYNPNETVAVSIVVGQDLYLYISKSNTKSYSYYGPASGSGLTGPVTIETDSWSTGTKTLDIYYEYESTSYSPGDGYVSDGIKTGHITYVITVTSGTAEKEFITLESCTEEIPEVLDRNTIFLKPTIAPEGATISTTSWKSSDPEVAKVKDGYVTVLKAGSTTISLEINKSMTCDWELDIEPISLQNLQITEYDAAQEEVLIFDEENRLVKDIDYSIRSEKEGNQTKLIITGKGFYTGEITEYLEEKTGKPSCLTHEWGQEEIIEGKEICMPDQKISSCKHCRASFALEIPVQANHSWDEGRILKEADCVEQGKKVFMCLVCKKEKYETIKSLDHTYMSGDIIKESTCTEAGEQEIICQECHVRKTKKLELAEHDWDFFEVITPAGEVERWGGNASIYHDGRVIEICKECKQKEEKSIACIKSVVLGRTEYVYNGEYQTPKIKAYDRQGNLIPEEYYDVKCENNLNAGRASYEVTFKKMYELSKKGAFYISPKSLRYVTVMLDRDSYLYTGSEIRPKVIALDGDKLLSSDDIVINYYNNYSVGGSPRVEVKGKNNYCDTKGDYFKIIKGKGNSKKIKDIKLNYDSIKLPKGEVQNLKVSVVPSKISWKWLEWECSDETIARILIRGNRVIVQGLKEGKTTIYAKAESGVVKTCEIEVTSPIVSTDIMHIAAKGKVNGADAIQNLLSSEEFASVKKYVSSDSKIASVNKKGIITGKKEGTVTITAYGKYGKQDIPIVHIQVNVTKPVFKINDTLWFPGEEIDLTKYVSGLPEGVPVSWEYKESKCVKKSPNDGCIIIGKKSGKAKITCVVGEGKYAARYTAVLKVKLI